MAINRDSRGQIALLPYHAFDSRGVGKGEDIYTSRFHNITAPGATDDPAGPHPLTLGTRYECEDGRMFVYVQQLTAAAPLGSVLEATADVGEDTVSSSTDLMIIETGGVDTTWVAGAFAGDYVYVDAGTGVGQCRRILQNTTTALHLDRPLTTALAVADSDITIIRPFRMILATAALTTPVSGVASVLNPDAGAGPGTSAIDLNSYGWIQVRGFCEHILIDNVASVAGQYLTCDDGVAGKAVGMPATTDVEDQRFFGVARAAATSNLCPGSLTNCILG